MAYHIGASLKDAGKKCFGINLIEDAGILSAIQKMRLFLILTKRKKSGEHTRKCFLDSCKRLVSFTSGKFTFVPE